MIDKYVIEPDFRLDPEDWNQMGTEAPAKRIHKRPKGQGWMARQNVTLYSDKVWLEVCPPKVVGRWNVYGSNDLREVVVETAPLVLKQLGINVCPSRLRGLKDGKFTVKGVDITEQFRLPGNMGTTYFIQKFMQQMFRIYKLVRHELGEGILINPGSARLTYYIYDKLVEFDARGMKAYANALEKVRGPDGLNFEAMGIAVDREEQRALAALGPRVELKFGDAYFYDNELSRGEQWKPETAEIIYRAGIDELKLPRKIQRDELAGDAYVWLKQPVLATFLLWLHGEDQALRMFSPTKLRIHAKEIERTLGVDIRKTVSVVIKVKSSVRPRDIFRWGNRVTGE